MKALLRWAGKVIGSAISAILVIILLPYASRMAIRLFPDESGAAIRTSATLSAQLSQSARLETLRVTEDGVIDYDIRAAILGTVGTVNVSYTYEASLGIDLQQVKLRVEQNTITFELPPVEVLQDTITPKEIYHDDFWYKGFTHADYMNLLETERLARRSAYLNEDAEETLWNATVTAFQAAIEPWIKEADGAVVFLYSRSSSQPES